MKLLLLLFTLLACIKSSAPVQMSIKRINTLRDRRGMNKLVVNHYYNNKFQNKQDPFQNYMIPNNYSLMTNIYCKPCYEFFTVGEKHYVSNIDPKEELKNYNFTYTFRPTKFPSRRPTRLRN